MRMWLTTFLIALLCTVQAGCMALAPIAGPALYAGAMLIKAFRHDPPAPADVPPEAPE